MKEITVIDYYVKKAADILRTLPVENLTVIFDEEDDGEITAIHFYNNRDNSHILTIAPTNRNEMH